MALKKICFQLHGFLGITAGMFLVVMGLSGGLISFQDEIIDGLNPGAVHAPAELAHGSQRVPLAPAALLAAIQASGETRRIERMELYTSTGRNPRITFAAMAGEAHGATGWANAYTGALQQDLNGAQFFAWVERLHIWLLLPTHIGQPVTGGLAACLLVLSLSGLYLRWPRRPGSLKAWLQLHWQRKGRPWLWELHSVVGTWALLVYLVLAGTGMYWGLPPLRAAVDGWAGVPPRAAKPASAQTAKATATPLQVPERGVITAAELALPWQGFERVAGAWQFVQIRLPRKPGQSFQFNWHTAEAAHAMARHRMTVAQNGSVQRDERFDQLPPARQALAAIYPLHMGNYFGLTGRIVVMLASLVMPLFAVTGWMLYLDRRRKARALARESGLHAAGGGPDGLGEPVGAVIAAVAVIHASQSGSARSLALRTAQRLRGAGYAVDLWAASQASPQLLSRYACTLWVVSTFGEGEPPDEARGLLRALQSLQLAAPSFAVLALGDSHYAHFCAFGLQLHAVLERAGAQPLWAAVTMDGESPQAWQAWCAHLGAHWQLPEGGEPAVEECDSPVDYRLVQRVHCNPGSLGAPLYRLELQPPEGPLPVWQAGALVEVWPRNAAERVQPLLDAWGLAGSERVTCHGQTMGVRQALSTSILLDLSATGGDFETVLSALQPIPPRRYSIASLPEEGGIQLWVRQALHEGGVGLASGWLTQQLAPGDTVQLRLLANPGFAPALQPGQAAILIGNGSGYAGLRALLGARMRHALHDNWLLFGERQRQADGWAEEEVQAWLASGAIRRADFAYSRDAGGPRYVQDIMRQHGDALRDWITQGAVVYVCGSQQGMAQGVEQALVQLLGAEGFERFAVSGRYRRDVY